MDEERRAVVTVGLPYSIAELLLRDARRTGGGLGEALVAALRDGRFVDKTNQPRRP